MHKLVDNLPTNFDAQITQWKQEMGVNTDTELAATIGVTAASISNWRTGKSNPTESTKKLISYLIKDGKKGKFSRLARM